MNVYDMIIDNDGTDFWVMRHSWANFVARITHVEKMKASPPYYGDADVLADLYDLRTGDMEHKGMVLSRPSSDQYDRVDVSDWNPTEMPRDLPFSALDEDFKKRLQKSQERAEKREAEKIRKREEDEAKPRLFFKSNEVFMTEKNNLYKDGFYTRWDSDRKLWWCLVEDERTQKQLINMGCILERHEPETPSP
jgi:hypothetical protein